MLSELRVGVAELIDVGPKTHNLDRMQSRRLARAVTAANPRPPDGFRSCIGHVHTVIAATTKSNAKGV